MLRVVQPVMFPSASSSNQKLSLKTIGKLVLNGAIQNAARSGTASPGPLCSQGCARAACFNNSPARKWAPRQLFSDSVQW